MLLVNGHQNFYILKLSELTVTSFIVNIPVKNHLLSFGLVWSQGVCVALEFWSCQFHCSSYSLKSFFFF